MFYLFGISINYLNFIFSENCNLILIEANDKKELYDKIFENNEIFFKIFRIEQKTYKKIKTDNQIKVVNQKNYKSHLYYKFFDSLEELKKYTRNKFVKLDLLDYLNNKETKFIKAYKNFQDVDVFFKELKTIMNFNLTCYFNNNELFLKGSLNETSSIKRFMKNNSFDKNLLKLIFDF